MDVPPLCVAIGPSSFAEEDPAPLRILEDAGLTVRPNPFGRRLTQEEIIEHLRGADGLIAGLEPLNRAVLTSAAPRLRAIARVGIGMTNVDQDAARELGIAVSNTPDGPVRAVAEMTLAALLAIARNIVPMSAALHAGSWKKTIGFGLEDTPVLIVGCGRIGRRAAELLQAFGARVLWHDPYVASPVGVPGERMPTLDEGLAQAEVVSLHAAGAQCLLGAAQFARMRDGAVLLNSARGELVDEAALVAALESGKVSAAWFDAFWKEPYHGPLTRFPQVLLTPHTGTYTRQCRRDMETQAVRNLLHDLT
ncbi:MAG: phosphoglycerate dehydrogenase [Candidatus Hydrogenedentes bacterium]|nr:phosphoglycerate dehydrogenase [Candidatus Hydrogenedentota bacterium]